MGLRVLKVGDSLLSPPLPNGYRCWGGRERRRKKNKAFFLSPLFRETKFVFFFWDVSSFFRGRIFGFQEADKSVAPPFFSLRFLQGCHSGAGLPPGLTHYLPLVHMKNFGWKFFDWIQVKLIKDKKKLRNKLRLWPNLSHQIFLAFPTWQRCFERSRKKSFGRRNWRKRKKKMKWRRAHFFFFLKRRFVKSFFCYVPLPPSSLSLIYTRGNFENFNKIKVFGAVARVKSRVWH